MLKETNIMFKLNLNWMLTPATLTDSEFFPGHIRYFIHSQKRISKSGKYDDLRYLSLVLSVVIHFILSLYTSLHSWMWTPSKMFTLELFRTYWLFWICFLPVICMESMWQLELPHTEVSSWIIEWETQF